MILMILLYFLRFDNIFFLISGGVGEIRNALRNDEIIGKIYIPHVLDTYIVKGGDNSYYLNHGIDKRKDVRGVPFIDSRLDLNANQINVYGHNSVEFDLPFKNLLRFLDNNFFISNNVIILELLDEIRIYQVFMIKEITTDMEHMIFYEGDEFVYHIERLMIDSINVADVYYDSESQILILQTCRMDSESYYIIGAIRI